MAIKPLLTVTNDSPFQREKVRGNYEKTLHVKFPLQNGMVTVKIIDREPSFLFTIVTSLLKVLLKVAPFQGTATTPANIRIIANLIFDASSITVLS